MATRKSRLANAHRPNRRRGEYTLTRPRYRLPLLLLAGLAAVGAHLLFMRATPWIYAAWESRFALPDHRMVKDEDMGRVIVTQDVEITQADPVEPPDEPQELEDMPIDTQEIDLLDAKLEELEITPGDTEIPLPEIPQTEPDNGVLPDIPLPDASELSPGDAVIDHDEVLPEPQPVNTNDVAVRVSAMQDNLISDAEKLIDKELSDRAAEGMKGLPSDTRSLADLMHVQNPGANSGVARLGADLLFDFGKCQLKNSARVTLLMLAALIHKNPDTMFIIEGHTDSVGKEDYNALLSLQRAAAVCQWLKSNDVPTKRVYMRACGSSHLLADGKLPRDKQALNRRVEIHMRKRGEPLPPDCLPASEKVDMKTPINTQLKAGWRPPFQPR